MLNFHTRTFTFLLLFLLLASDRHNYDAAFAPAANQRAVLGLMATCPATGRSQQSGPVTMAGVTDVMSTLQ